MEDIDHVSSADESEETVWCKENNNSIYKNLVNTITQFSKSALLNLDVTFKYFDKI